MQHYNTSLQTSNTCLSFDSMHRIIQETAMANSRIFLLLFVIAVVYVIVFRFVYLCCCASKAHLSFVVVCKALNRKKCTGEKEQVGRAWENFLSRWLVVAPQFLACCGSWFVGSGQQSRLWTIFGQSADSRHWSRLIYGITSLSSSSLHQNLPSLLFFFNHNTLGGGGRMTHDACGW